MSSPATALTEEKIDLIRSERLKETQPVFKMSILSYFQIGSILITGLYFIINHDSVADTKLQSQQVQIDKISNRLDSMDAKIDSQTTKLAEIDGKIDLIIYHQYPYIKKNQ